MNIFFKKIVSTLTLLLVAFMPGVSFADDPSLEFSSVLSVAQVPGQYVLHTTLQATNVTSFSNLKLIGIVDDPDANYPYTTIVELPMTQTNGAFNISIPLNYDPTGDSVQFILVDSISFTTQGGIYLFNTANSSNYTTYLATVIDYYNTNTEGDNTNGDNTDPQIDCTDPAYVDDLACQEPPGAPEYDPNFVLTGHIENPLGVDFNIIDFLQALFKNIIKLVLPFLVLFMVYSGFLFVEARGDTEKLAKARENFKYVIIGALLILGSWTIAEILKGTVNQLESSSVIIKNLINLV